MKQRLDAEPDRTTVGELWTATKMLLGLRYEVQVVGTLLRGVRAMKESTTYQAMLEEGRVEEVREEIRRLGERKFKSMLPAPVRTTIENILNLEELRRLL